MSNNNPQAEIFDLDGTLIDTAPTFVILLNELLNKHGKAPLTADIIREHVSHGARALITIGFGPCESDENFKELRNELPDLDEPNLVNGTQLFKGMQEVLDKLKEKNIPWGIVTNKPTRFTFPLIHQLGINDQCSVVICPDDVENTKPDPEPRQLACFRLNVQPERCIYIGDHERDIQAGNAAGMLTVTALFGYIPLNENTNNWHANEKIEKPADLIKLVDQG